MRYIVRWMVVAVALPVLPAFSACNPDPGQAARVDGGGPQAGSMEPVAVQADAAAEDHGSDASSSDEPAPQPGAASADAATPAEAGPVVTMPSRDAAAPRDGAQDAAAALLTQLSVAELTTLCRWVEGLRAVPSERQLCISRSLQARSRAACATQVESCLAAHSVEVPPKPQCNESFVQKLPARCAMVEVDDYRSCAQAAADRANQRLSSLSCDQVDTPDPGTQGVVPACADLVRVCPELAPDDSGATSPWSGGSFVCRDGWPLFSDEVCNGKADCLGGEDETKC